MHLHRALLFTQFDLLFVELRGRASLSLKLTPRFLGFLTLNFEDARSQICLVRLNLVLAENTLILINHFRYAQSHSLSLRLCSQFLRLNFVRSRHSCCFNWVNPVRLTLVD